MSLEKAVFSDEFGEQDVGFVLSGFLDAHVSPQQ
jgi:hypothetical protein